MQNNKKGVTTMEKANKEAMMEEFEGYERIPFSEYEKIPFEQISDIEQYVENKLREGHIIFQILVNETNCEIDELISYANDKEAKSVYRYLADSDEQLKSSVIETTIIPYYAFKDPDRYHIGKIHIETADIDINNCSENILSFFQFKGEFGQMEEYFSEKSFQLDDCNEVAHYEFYISKGIGDIENIDANLEPDFVEEWMIEKGYYKV
jgi:hypothetical protein